MDLDAPNASLAIQVLERIVGMVPSNLKQGLLPAAPAVCRVLGAHPGEGDAVYSGLLFHCHMLDLRVPRRVQSTRGNEPTQGTAGGTGTPPVCTWLSPSVRAALHAAVHPHALRATEACKAGSFSTEKAPLIAKLCASLMDSDSDDRDALRVHPGHT